MEIDRCGIVRGYGLLGGTYNNLSFYRQYLGTFSKLRIGSSYLSVCMQQLGSHWTDFLEIWYLSNFQKPVKKVQVYVISGSCHEVDENSGVPRGGLGCSNTPPQNSEDISGVLDRISKKNRRLDFLLQFTVFSYCCNLLNKGFF